MIAGLSMRQPPHNATWMPSGCDAGCC